MAGFFGAIGTSTCVTDVFYGTDYNSHLGTRRGGMATFSEEKGFKRSIHHLENTYFRTKFEKELDEFDGNAGIGIISDTDAQPLLFNSHLGRFAICTVAKINNMEQIASTLLEQNMHLSEFSSGKINQTELAGLLIVKGKDFVDGIENVFREVKGSCTMLLLTENGIIAARDSWGRTPIIIGKKDGEFGTTKERDFDDLTFPGDGVYDVVPVSRIHGTEEWHPCKGADKMYFTITVENNSITNVIAHPQAPSTNNMSATFDFEGDMEANQDNIVHVNVSNLGDDFWGTVRLYYSTSSSSSLPSTYIEQLASIKPNESTVDFTVKLPKGEYKLWFLVNPSSSPYASDAIATGKMFIGYGADANKVQAGNLQFDGQTGTALEMKSVNGVLANELTGSFDITNSSGHTYNNTYYVLNDDRNTVWRNEIC